MKVPRNTAATALALSALALSGSAPFQAVQAQDATDDVRVAAVEVPAETMAVSDTAHENDIVEVAAAAGQFETLLTAAEAAGLAETLSSGGPFTVFAPTDEAFAALPEGTVESLLDAPDELRAVLTYHVVSGEVTSEQVVKLGRAETVNGAELRIEVRDGEVRVNDARVVTADVQASNGVIHVIDTVLLPPRDE